jgi:Rrf2 family protein
MKLSEGVEWGLHCVSVLAELPPGATLPTKSLAELHGLSETYLSKHLQALTNAHIIESVPGPKGGYHLIRPPEEVTLLEIVEAIDGHEPLFRCTEIRQQGPLALESQTYHMPCGIHVAMARADKAWRDVLRSQTLADIVTHYSQDVDPHQRQRRDQWVSGHTRHTPKKS